MTTIALTWSQVHAWRLAQHGLAPRLSRQDFLQAVSCTGGIQAQVLSAAELALWARVQSFRARTSRPPSGRSAAWSRPGRCVAPYTCCRHEDLPLYVAARSRHDSRNWAGYFAYYGLTSAQQEAFLTAVPQVLGSEPMTRQQLADALVSHTGIAALRELILHSSWGSPLKPSAFRGDLCFGPSQGQNVTFVNPRAWLAHGRRLSQRRRCRLSSAAICSPTARLHAKILRSGGGVGAE